jgi:hypothetical protein
MGQRPIDHAHVFEVGSHPEHYIKTNNVYLLCRGAHRRMDDFQNPLTGKPIDKNEHFYWWWRIMNSSTEPYEEDIDYREKCWNMVVN